MPKNEGASMPDPQPLDPQDAQVLATWSPSFFRLPIHAVIEQEMEVCMKGIESGAVIGRRGSGKSYTIAHLVTQFEAKELREALSKEGKESYVPREVVYYETSDAHGAKTALVDLYETLLGPLSAGERRMQTPKSLLEQISEEAKRRNLRLICVDEAQKIDPKNLDMLRQVADFAHRLHQHPMGLLLIGSEELHRSIKATGQGGQRIATVIEMPVLTAGLISPHLDGFHPHLAALRAQLGAKEWRVLEEEFFRAVHGSFRRLQIILANANQLALRMNRRLDAEVLRFAIHKLAPEE